MDNVKPSGTSNGESLTEEQARKEHEEMDHDNIVCMERVVYGKAISLTAKQNLETAWIAVRREVWKAEATLQRHRDRGIL